MGEIPGEPSLRLWVETAYRYLDEEAVTPPPSEYQVIAEALTDKIRSEEYVRHTVYTLERDKEPLRDDFDKRAELRYRLALAGAVFPDASIETLEQQLPPDKQAELCSLITDVTH